MKCSWDRKFLPGYPEGFAHKEKQWPTRVPAGIPVFFPTRSVDFVVCSWRVSEGCIVKHTLLSSRQFLTAGWYRKKRSKHAAPK